MGIWTPSTTIGSAIFAQLTASVIGIPGHDLSPKIAPSLLIHAFLGPPVSTAYFKEYLDQFSRLCTADVRMSLGMSGHAHALPLNIAHSEIWTPI